MYILAFAMTTYLYEWNDKMPLFYCDGIQNVETREEDAWMLNLCKNENKIPCHDAKCWNFIN